MTPESLSQILAEFLEGARAAAVVEDGAIAFDLAESKYSVSGEYNKCLLYLGSSERNFVRRVLDAEVKTPPCGCRCSAWARIARRDSISVAIAIGAYEPRCDAHWREIFSAGPWSDSQRAWISNTPSVLRSCGDGCAKDNARSPLWG